MAEHADLALAPNEIEGLMRSETVLKVESFDKA